jgi:hypothetical protein
LRGLPLIKTNPSEVPKVFTLQLSVIFATEPWTIKRGVVHVFFGWAGFARLMEIPPAGMSMLS